MKNIIKNLYRVLIMIYLKIKYFKKNVVLKSYYINKDVVLEQNVTIGKRVFISNNVKIGKYSYCNSNYNWSMIESNVTIGKYCSIGPNVCIGLGNHNYKFISTHPFLYNSKYGFIKSDIKYNAIDNDEKETIIGNDVWIGANANIKRGIRIGDGAIIAMNAVVTKDVPDYAIVAGVPATIIKYRFLENQIKEIKKDPWWNKEDYEIKENIDRMYDINEYLNLK